MASQVSGIAVSSGSGSNENYTLISGYDIYDRDYYKYLIGKVPRASALKWMRNVKGFMKRKATRHEYYFHEKGQWYPTVCTIAAASDQSTFVRITIASADHDVSGTQSYPTLNNTVLFENEVVGFVRALSRAVDSAHTFDVYPADTTNVNVVAAAVVGSKCSFFGNAHKENSTATDTRIPKTTKVTNYIQTFRGGYKVTDHASQNETEPIMIKGKKFLHPVGIDDEMDRFEMAIENSMLVGTASSGLTDASSNSIRTVKGLIPQVTDSGNTLEYYGSPDMSTVDDAIMILNNSYGEHEYMVGQGIKINLAWKNWLIDFAKYKDNVSFSSFDGGEKQALNFNFKGINIEPYSFYFQTWDCLGHPDSLGAGNMPYPDMAIFIPMGSTKNEDPGGGGNQESYLQLVYSPTNQAANQDKGTYATWSTGALAPGGATNDEANWMVHVIGYQGLEVRCRNKFLVMRKAA